MALENEPSNEAVLLEEVSDKLQAALEEEAMNEETALDQDSDNQRAALELELKNVQAAPEEVDEEIADERKFCSARN